MSFTILGFFGICSALSLSLSYAEFVTIYFLISVTFGTYLRLDQFLGSARGCPGSTYISLCAWISQLAGRQAGTDVILFYSVSTLFCVAVKV